MTATQLLHGGVEHAHDRKGNAAMRRAGRRLQLPLVRRNGLQQAVALLLQVRALPAHAVAQQLLLEAFCCHREVDD